MDSGFKIKLLALYPEFDRVTGPYLRKDGRKHICLNNIALSKGDKNKTKTLSWPKALIEVKIGRILLDNETADHIDEDFTNDDISNLQILTRPANIIKSFETNPERARKWFVGNCPICGEKFTKYLNDVQHNRKMGKAGPFCSRSCAGKFNEAKRVYANRQSGCA